MYVANLDDLMGRWDRWEASEKNWNIGAHRRTIRPWVGFVDNSVHSDGTVLCFWCHSVRPICEKIVVGILECVLQFYFFTLGEV